MFGVGAKLLRSATTVSRAARAATARQLPSPLFPSSPSRLVHGDKINVPDANPVALQMINYALSHARSQKSDDSYSQGMLVLEQCLSNQLSEGRDAENSRGLVLLAMSTILSERGDFDGAMEKLRVIEGLKNSSLGVRVAAIEALIGLNLELGQDDASSVLADKCLELLAEEPIESGSAGSMISARAKAVKGLVELVHGDLDSAGSYFQGSDGDKYSTGSVALSYGQFLHSTMNFLLAKEIYQKVIQGTSENEGLADAHLAACNMIPEEVALGATCALGQLESHLGNFGDAEEILTKALTKTEEYFGSYHPKVGVVLTCIALMFRWKAMKDRSSSLLVQEGLFRRATDLLKAPALDSKGTETKAGRRDVIALAREALCVQQNRNAEGEKLKSWAESAWKNHRLSLSEALDWPGPSSHLPIIDSRTSRVL
ncbi:hypothetical protein CRG98_040220 [Punica granatum]|uniref:MalT-like TPR region domain-containing protein n=1 Tax=Punica granatum TaxID=22663 RepID=A0A2I0I5S8_PUNGR|nr:hypothetical protein CRG98_040220 [Punica granatum]